MKATEEDILLTAFSVIQRAISLFGDTEMGGDWEGDANKVLEFVQDHIIEADECAHEPGRVAAEYENGLLHLFTDCVKCGSPGRQTIVPALWDWEG